jgi:biopolymer transport protein ExbB/TolQ
MAIASNSQLSRRSSLLGGVRSFLAANTIPLGAVALFALALKSTMMEGVWLFDFFFKRQFVQWLLLSIFAMAIFRLFQRIPTVIREQNALANLQSGVAPPPLGLVGRRWHQLQTIISTRPNENHTEYSKQLAEHDAAEVDAAYRLSGDVVQILPLIGFFGTVLGLSFGLYENFLKAGGATTAAFAKAIAIAFDNTLLGLALTIILFAVQSVLRKREDAILLQLDLIATSQNHAEPAPSNTLKIAVEENVAALIVSCISFKCS